MCVYGSVIRLERWPACAWTTPNSVFISIVSIRPLANRSSGSPCGTGRCRPWICGWLSFARPHQHQQVEDSAIQHSSFRCRVHDRGPICHHPSVPALGGCKESLAIHQAASIVGAFPALDHGLPWHASSSLRCSLFVSVVLARLYDSNSVHGYAALFLPLPLGRPPSLLFSRAISCRRSSANRLSRILQLRFRENATRSRLQE